VADLAALAADDVLRVLSTTRYAMERVTFRLTRLAQATEMTPD